MTPQEESHQSWEQAQQAAGTDHQIIGFYKDTVDCKQPLYFTLPRGATDEEIEAAVFEHVHGQAMSDLDLTIRRLYLQHEHRLDRYRTSA
jgi:hypothetical protein